jgi:hypothetical protein
MIPEEIASYTNRLIVAGTRRWEDKLLFKKTIEMVLGELTGNVLFISGGCPTGPDNTIIRYCKAYKKPCLVMKADWDVHGKKAGMLRNKEMSLLATGLIAFWDGSSPGTKNMIDTMVRQDKKTWVTFTTSKRFE